MDVVFPFALLCFTSLFTITNPLSMMPVFLTMTHSMDEKARRAIVKKASIIACITLILFVLAGQFLFKFFGISTDGFRIVGGFIIFRIGYDMLQAKYTSVKLKDEEIKEYVDDITVTPLAIPMLCGPGAIANAIMLMQEAQTFDLKITLVIVILLVYLSAYFILSASTRLTRYNVMMRLMGLILMVIAVECFVSGIRPIMSSIIGS